jgi:1-acyl-sn-glycerol-3-phosphate acyltransferase
VKYFPELHARSIHGPVTQWKYAVPMHKLKLLTGLRLVPVGLHLLYGAGRLRLLFPFAEQCRVTTSNDAGRANCWPAADRTGAARGLADIRSGLLVANHVSFVDIFAINALLPSVSSPRAMSPAGPDRLAARRNDTVFIERGKPKARTMTRQRMLEVLAAGRRLAVFPEGTTTAGDRVLPFHGALFQGAIDSRDASARLAIELCRLDGLRSDAPAYIGELSLIECLCNIIESGGLGRGSGSPRAFCPATGPTPPGPSSPSQAVPPHCTAGEIWHSAATSRNARQSARNARSKNAGEPKREKRRTPCKAKTNPMKPPHRGRDARLPRRPGAQRGGSPRSPATALQGVRRGTRRPRPDAPAEPRHRPLRSLLRPPDRARNRSGRIVGTYRILSPAAARRVGNYYSENEFHINRLHHLRNRMVEVGRSCIHPDHRSGA